MKNIITRRSLERELNKLKADFFIVGTTAVDYENVYCFISAYDDIRKQHPNVKTAKELALLITSQELNDK